MMQGSEKRLKSQKNQFLISSTSKPDGIRFNEEPKPLVYFISKGALASGYENASSTHAAW
jgi:hypothetical protein